MHVEADASPFFDRFGLYDFVCGSQIESDAQARAGLTSTEELGEELIISKRRLNKYLGAVLFAALCLEFFDFSASFTFVNREVTVKSELLTIEARSHQGQ